MPASGSLLSRRCPLYCASALRALNDPHAGVIPNAGRVGVEIEKDELLYWHLWTKAENAVLLIAARILAASKLAQCDGGTRVPAPMSALAEVLLGGHVLFNYSCTF